MKIKCALSISRPCYSNGSKLINITIVDETSGIEFFDGTIPYAEFTEALTGLSRNKNMDAELRHLEFVGKLRVTEPREIKCPLKHARREEFEKWLAENTQENGWMVSTHLRSQSSITYVDGGALLRYSVTKYITQEEPL